MSLRMKKAIWTGFLASVLWVAMGDAQETQVNDKKVTENQASATSVQLAAIASPYTPLIQELLKAWPPKDLKFSDTSANPIQLEAIENSAHPDYVGCTQVMVIRAPLEKVQAVIDDFGHYKELFEGFDDVHVISQKDNQTRLFWEQHIPVFFLSNEKYESVYVSDLSRPNLKMYRWQLTQGGSLQRSDGFIVLERDGANTKYVEYDFNDANWSIFSHTSKPWFETIEGIYLSDLAIAFKAEHSDWDYKKIHDEAHKLLDQFPVKKVVESKIPWDVKFRRALGS
jgi:hypothetical protein